MQEEGAEKERKHSDRPWFDLTRVWKDQTKVEIVPHYSPTRAMVLILDGNSELGAYVRSNICYWICLRNLITSRAFTNRSLKDQFFLMRVQPIKPCNISTMRFYSFSCSF